MRAVAHMHAARVLALAVGLVPATAGADWFYAALKVTCDWDGDSVTIVNASAYNEGGIRKADERHGIYIPYRNWPKRSGIAVTKEHRCKTRSSDPRQFLGN